MEAPSLTVNMPPTSMGSSNDPAVKREVPGVQLDDNHNDHERFCTAAHSVSDDDC